MRSKRAFFFFFFLLLSVVFPEEARAIKKVQVCWEYSVSPVPLRWDRAAGLGSFHMSLKFKRQGLRANACIHVDRVE